MKRRKVVRHFDVLLMKDLQDVITDILNYDGEGTFSLENDRYKIRVTITEKGEEEWMKK
tara:strand:+ start:590 stop:766 length:177 start_codon:yes stop_codon:yes gene_type:complete